MPVQSTIDNKLYYNFLQQEKFNFYQFFYIKMRVFACSGFHKFAKIRQEMKKILYFILCSVVCIFNADAALRGTKTNGRNRDKVITTNTNTSRSATSRNAVKTVVSARGAKNVSVLTPKNVATRTSTARVANNKQTRSVSARATTSQAMSETRTGAAYEQCKSAFFTCMDQFCKLKNDSYRRCSCSDRIYDLQEIADTYQSAAEKLGEFAEDLDVVGMTYNQALAMKTSSEGEDALTEDKSASKRLLQAIMNSIKGGDTSVGGKYQDLNSVTISSDVANAFGMDDSGQIIASYNGTTLYKAVFPKCKNAVEQDCNKASLQRAINAYLMAIEQDCNTVESALQAQQKTLKASTHQSSAMLDLARVENRRNHNSDDVATCLANVEQAVLSEQVCGANYHKCLDNGQFIDVTTGAPLTGVADFYKLGEILTFKDNVNLKDQKLSSIQNNNVFVQFFESKTKKFAKDALDKCSEDADYVWQQYLDRALLDIYYAQNAKVSEIQQSCLTLVANCYDNQNTSIANAMASLTGDSTILLKPATISLTTELCDKYIQSCDGMFDGNIIQKYIATKDSSDSLSACRAIAQRCFDKFGGTGYNNLYYTQSGLFTPGQALDWFSLYDKTNNDGTDLISPCAQQLAQTTGCADKIEEVFGGFDRYTTNENKIIYSAESGNDSNRKIRTSGIATEVYYKILDNLANHCNGLGGYFVEYKFAEKYGYKQNDFCKIDSNNTESVFYTDSSYNNQSRLVYWYHFVNEENMCPANYETEVDTQSWGMCSCWENGGYRSKNGQTATCRPIIPAISGTSTSDDPICSEEVLCKEKDTTSELCKQPRSNTSQYWCQQTIKTSRGQICPTMKLRNDKLETGEDNFVCIYVVNKEEKDIDAMKKVPSHKTTEVTETEENGN